MSFGKNKKTSSPAPEVAGTDTEEYSTNQEATPIPYIAGERKVSVRWLSRAYNQFAREAPKDRPGKK